MNSSVPNPDPSFLEKPPAALLAAEDHDAPDAMDKLNVQIKQTCPSLTTSLLYSRDNQVFMKIVPRKHPLRSWGPEYLLPFHLIVTLDCADEMFKFRLCSFWGQTVQEELVPVKSVIHDQLDCRLLTLIQEGSVRLCSGFSSEISLKTSLIHSILINVVDNSLKMRHKRCQILLPPDDDLTENNCQTCRDFESRHRRKPMKRDKEASPDLKREIFLSNVEVKLEEGREERPTKRRKCRKDSFVVDNDDNVEEKYEVPDPEEEEGDEWDSSDPLLEDRIHFCHECGKTFARPKAYVSHIKSCGKKDFPSSEDKKPTLTKRRGDVKINCKVCLKIFHSVNHFKRHMEKHEQRLSLTENVSCPECGLEMAKLEINDHFIGQHDREKGVCVDCVQVMPISELFLHVSKHFLNAKKHLCPICGDKFRTPLDLRVHQSYHDSKETSVVCDICGKVYSHKKRLVRHIRVSHNKAKKYPCHLCDKVFYEKHRLDKHLRTHSAVKPFCCVHCPFRSVRRDNVLLHVRKIHKKESQETDVVKDGIHNIKGANLDHVKS